MYFARGFLNATVSTVKIAIVWVNIFVVIIRIA